MAPWHQLIQEIEPFPREIRNARVSPQVSPQQIRAELESRSAFDAPVPLETLTEDVIRLLHAGSLYSSLSTHVGARTVRKHPIQPERETCSPPPQQHSKPHFRVWAYLPESSYTPGRLRTWHRRF